MEMNKDDFQHQEAYLRWGDVSLIQHGQGTQATDQIQSLELPN